MKPDGGCLLVSCSAGGEKQFSGIRLLMKRLAEAGCEHAEWLGFPLEMSRRRELTRVLVSGHGAETEPAFRGPGPDGEPRLRPALLRLPAKATLFLLGCYQGRPDFRRAWAGGCEVGEERVRGCEGETESALSTCLLLHLLEEGPGSLERWFAVWVRCNVSLAPYFPQLRAAYTASGGDPLETWELIREMPALQPFTDFLGAAERHPEYLTGLA